MSDPYVREIGTVADFDGDPLRVGVDYDTVTVGGVARTWEWRFAPAQVEEFLVLFARACTAAGANKRRMDAEAGDA